ncbi:uncharacterized protein LOC124899635 [Capsicum annuum]|uniref:uncharacterized protein LOC124899635 n=1 Tax=Capsicum annuum TaxID=4072 RepID=UPI001FB15EA1|nr:uncharacterized protein LOC124899635 [Capsicum annuum]
MDVIIPIEPSTSNVHRFVLVAIDYFTKWVEVASYRVVTKKVVADYVRNNLICGFRVPESIITDNGENFNSHLMNKICDQFKIAYRNSAAYRPHLNGAMEAAKKYQEDFEENGKLLMSNEKWVRARYEQHMLIDEKRMVSVCHDQLYQYRMVRAFNEKVRARTFEVGQLVLKRIFPHQENTKVQEEMTSLFRQQLTQRYGKTPYASFVN